MDRFFQGQGHHFDPVGVVGADPDGRGQLQVVVGLERELVGLVIPPVGETTLEAMFAWVDPPANGSPTCSLQLSARGGR